MEGAGLHALVDGRVRAQLVGADDLGGDDGDAHRVGPDGALADGVALDPAAVLATEFEAALLHHVPLRRPGVVVEAGAPLSGHIPRAPILHHVRFGAGHAVLANSTFVHASGLGGDGCIRWRVTRHRLRMGDGVVSDRSAGSEEAELILTNFDYT